MSNVIKFPVIAGVEITTDSEGRFNLNALHKASGLGANKAPAQFLRSTTAKDLSEEIEKQTMQICTVTVEGRNGGTFADRLLAISYAGWISPKFQLTVNQTFLDYSIGNLAPVSEINLNDANQVRKLVVQTLEKIEEDRPKVEFHDKVVASEGAISIAEAAKIIGTGQKRLFALLRQIGWVSRRNEPYQAKIECGYMDVKISDWDHPSFGVQKSVTALLTGKGLSKLEKLYRDKMESAA